MFMPGLVLGRLFDMGHLRVPVLLASALLIACTFLTGECKEFWQFLLCQGFGIGVRSLLPSAPLLPTYAMLDGWLAGERCRVHRCIWCRAPLVPQESRTSFCLHGERLEYRWHDLPHYSEEPHRASEVGPSLRIYVSLVQYSSRA